MDDREKEKRTRAAITSVAKDHSPNDQSLFEVGLKHWEHE